MSINLCLLLQLFQRIKKQQYSHYRMDIYSSDSLSGEIIERSSDSDVEELLEYTLVHFPQPKPSVLKALSDAAIKTKKINSLVVLITHNANPSIASVIKLIDWETPNEALLNFVLINGTAIEIAQFVTNNFKTTYGHGNKDPAGCIPDCVKKMLYSNGPIRRKLLSGILNEPATIHNILIINLLIKFGANSSDICQLRFKNSTPLHAAVELALESGKNYALILCTINIFLTSTFSFE